jgi:hypothetical protein
VLKREGHKDEWQKRPWYQGTAGAVEGDDEYQASEFAASEADSPEHKTESGPKRNDVEIALRLLRATDRQPMGERYPT